MVKQAFMFNTLVRANKLIKNSNIDVKKINLVFSEIGEVDDNLLKSF